MSIDAENWPEIRWEAINKRSHTRPLFDYVSYWTHQGFTSRCQLWEDSSGCRLSFVTTDDMRLQPCSTNLTSDPMMHETELILVKLICLIQIFSEIKFYENIQQDLLLFDSIGD